MKIFLVGSTGPTGLHLIDQALARGLEVITVVRSPEKITTKHEKLTVIEGSVLQDSVMVEPMRGCDAVVSAIGGKNGTFNPCSIYTASGAAIVKAMREAGVKRLIVCTAWATKDHSELPLLWRWVLRLTLIRNVLRDMAEFEDYLALECKDLTVTVVRPGVLTNEPASGKKPEEAIDKYSVGNSWWIGGSISRADVAKFMLDCLDNPAYDNKSVAII
ncbi:flavin reductase (NADPH) [Plakobranchus ocellatus]|uniref:Flavin reductase (NADPH) n=1 Tax=Plakobranchus ocellatus TaxID=259542 RepID=A0AAV4C9H1_9GAST|nr:flavin reductase (NADPH) [Plakobranchus ocellatus]